MPGHLPTLDCDALDRLRALVCTLHANNGRNVPMIELVALANEAGLDAGVTIDFQATRDLGQPMVVLRLPPNNHPAECLKVLSKREREIAGLLADGLSNKQIARRLFLALPTVKDHVHRILHKTNLPNRAAVAAACKGHVSNLTVEH